MTRNVMSIAEAFYTEMGNKNVNDMEKYLHPDVQFTAPLAKLKGKEAYLEALNGFVALFQTLKIRALFGSQDQAMVVYDLDVPAPIGNMSSAAHLTFENDLISKVELFYDARPFER